MQVECIMTHSLAEIARSEKGNNQGKLPEKPWQQWSEGGRKGRSRRNQLWLVRFQKVMVVKRETAIGSKHPYQPSARVGSRLCFRMELDL